MHVSGIVEKIDDSDKQRAIKIHLRGVAKVVWVPPELHPQIRDLKEGVEETFEVADTMRWYYVFRSWERGEASAPNKQDPPESPTQTEKEPEPPNAEIVVKDEKLADLANRIVKIRDHYELNVTKDILSLHWEIGQEIHPTRWTDEHSYTELSRVTGIGRSTLQQSVAFYEKYPKRDYEIKAWRRHVAELPEIKEIGSPLPEDP